MATSVFELFGSIAIKNRDANEALKDTATKAERTGKQIQEAFKKIGSVSMKIGKGVMAAATAIGASFTATVEGTREYRTAMAKLDAAFIANGHSAETAYNTYKDLQRVLGDTDQATEAANHLAVLCDSEQELDKWTKICQGVYATFGDSLPIEGLTEAANETAKTGQLTGSLADALNWAGIKEDDFQKKLEACRTEEERQNLIMDTLYWTYQKAADQYEETGKSVMSANEAQEKLNSAMAKLGEIGEPIMTGLKSWIADMVLAAVPHIESIVSAFSNLEKTWTEEVWPAIQKDWKMNFGIDLPDWETFKAEIAAGWETVKTGIKDFFKITFGVDMPSWSDISASIRAGWESVKQSIAGLFRIDVGWGIGGGSGSNEVTITENHAGAVGSFASGLDYVPHDGFYARLHKGEAILTSAQANEWRGGGSGRIEALLAQMVTLLSQQKNIVLDSGVMVGQLAPAMDGALGTIASRKRRGS